MKPAGWRDRIAWFLCNAILRTVATKWYRQMIEGAIGYGLASAARDETEGLPPPAPARFIPGP